MTGTAKAGTAGQRRAVFAVDEDAALAALEEKWAEGGYHAFGVATAPGRRSAAPGRC